MTKGRFLISIILFSTALSFLTGQEFSRIEVKESEIDTELERFILQKNMEGKEFNDEEITQLKENIKEGILMRKLLVSLAVYRGVSISDEELDHALSLTRGDYPQNEWEALLSQQGYTEESFRVVLEDSLLIDRILESEVLDKITVSDSEVETYYEEHIQEFSSDHGTIPLGEVRDLIKQNLLTLKGQQEVSRFMDDLYAQTMFVEKE